MGEYVEQSKRIELFVPTGRNKNKKTANLLINHIKKMSRISSLQSKLVFKINLDALCEFLLSIFNTQEYGKYFNLNLLKV